MSVSAFIAIAMQFVHAHSGYPIPDAPKIIIVKTQTEMTRLCGSDAYACTMTDSGVIYFPKSCDKEMTLECKGALIHEITHYMDFKDHGWDRCTEKEAYGNEDAYYHKHGSSLEAFGYSKAYLAILTKCDW